MNVGDYVRINGEIGKIINCPEQLKKNYGNWLWFETTNEQCPIRNEDIIKSSPNIIDLIEVGDYINGYKVLNVLDFNDNSEMLSLEKIYDSKITNEDIKSIVTKEQFEEISYKIGEQ